MVCIPGRIRTCQSQAMYTERMEGRVEVGKQKAHCVGCTVCGKDLAAPSLRSHLETEHGIYRSFVLSRDLVDKDRPPVMYQATSKKLHRDRQICVPHSRLRGDGEHEVRATMALLFFAPAGLNRRAGGGSLPQVQPLRDAGEPDGHGSPGHEEVQGHARR